MKVNTESTEKVYNIFEENSKVERQKLQAQLESLKRKRKSKTMWFFGLLFAAFITSMVTFSYYLSYSKFDIAITIFSLCVSLILSLFMIFYIKFMFEMRENSIQRKLYEIDAVYAQKDVEEDIFENSLKMSYKYLDQYYLQTKEQAQRGFAVTVGVAIFGAILIGGGIIAMLFGATNPSYVTCAAGIITEFISSIFFYLYNKTISSMSKYHNKLVLSQSISIALKVSESLNEEDKVETKKLIVAELMKDINNHLVRTDGNEKSN